MALILVLVLSLYCLLLMAFLYGWSEARWHVTPPAGMTMHGISVVVPFRNEELNLENIISDLSSMAYVKDSYEVILVNDHSTDASRDVVARRIEHLRNFRLLELADGVTGKKQALDFAIRASRFEIIATTDADCRVHEQWLWHICTYFERAETQLLVGAVKLQSDESLFSRLQTLEFSSLIGTGAAAIGLEHPILCNGANLSFRKNCFHAVGGYEGNLNVASGDDEFLLRKIMARYPEGIRFLNTPEGVVSSTPQPTMNDFMGQRIRWAGKWKYNTDRISRTLALFIVVAQMTYVGLWISFVMEPGMVITFLLIKIILEIVFLVGIARFLQQRFDPMAFVLWQVLYPVYVLAIGVWSLQASYRWKDRNYK